jgi:nanoRNase/pAp phosphatase (c-di-AMP/oligoRNAs hydrolase)
MPPKKSKQYKGQPTLTTFLSNESTELEPAEAEQRYEREAQKLLRLRREIEQREREEQRVMRNILTLQISEDAKKESPNEEDEDEEYWVMTTEQSV